MNNFENKTIENILSIVNDKWLADAVSMMSSVRETLLEDIPATEDKEEIDCKMSQAVAITHFIRDFKQLQKIIRNEYGKDSRG